MGVADRLGIGRNSGGGVSGRLGRAPSAALNDPSIILGVDPNAVASGTDEYADKRAASIKSAAQDIQRLVGAGKFDEAKRLSSQYQSAFSEEELAALKIEVEQQGAGVGTKAFLAADNATGGGLSRGLTALDKPRAAVTGMVRQAASSNLQGVQDVTGIDTSGIRENLGPQGLDALKKDIDENTGFGTLLNEATGGEGTGNKWVDRGIGLVGDVGLDPLTYMTFGGKSAIQKASMGVIESKSASMAAKIRATGVKSLDAAEKAAYDKILWDAAVGQAQQAARGGLITKLSPSARKTLRNAGDPDAIAARMNTVLTRQGRSGVRFGVGDQTRTILPTRPGGLRIPGLQADLDTSNIIEDVATSTPGDVLLSKTPLVVREVDEAGDIVADLYGGPGRAEGASLIPEGATPEPKSSILGDIPEMTDEFDTEAADNVLRAAAAVAPPGTDTVVKVATPDGTEHFVLRNADGEAAGFLSIADGQVDSLYINKELAPEPRQADRLYQAAADAGHDIQSLGADQMTPAGRKAREGYLSRATAPKAAPEVSYGKSQRAGKLVDKEGRELGPDDVVTLYHNTDAETAERLRAAGTAGGKTRREPTIITDESTARALGKNVGDPMDYEPGRGMGEGLYLSPEPNPTFGDVALPVQIRVGDLAVAPERAAMRKADPVKSLLVGDGYTEAILPPAAFGGAESAAKAAPTKKPSVRDAAKERLAEGYLSRAGSTSEFDKLSDPITGNAGDWLESWAKSQPEQRILTSPSARWTVEVDGVPVAEDLNRYSVPAALESAAQGGGTAVIKVSSVVGDVEKTVDLSDLSRMLSGGRAPDVQEVITRFASNEKFANALESYKTAVYRDGMGGSLETVGKHLDKLSAADRKAIDNALAKAGVPDEVVIYRGTGEAADRGSNRVRGEWTNGTLKREVAEGYAERTGGIVEEFRVPRSAIAGFGNAEEWEVLFKNTPVPKTKKPSVRDASASRLAALFPEGKLPAATPDKIYTPGEVLPGVGEVLSVGDGIKIRPEKILGGLNEGARPKILKQSIGGKIADSGVGKSAKAALAPRAGVKSALGGSAERAVYDAEAVAAGTMNAADRDMVNRLAPVKKAYSVLSKPPESLVAAIPALDGLKGPDAFNVLAEGVLDGTIERSALDALGAKKAQQVNVALDTLEDMGLEEGLGTAVISKEGQRHAAQLAEQLGIDEKALRRGKAVDLEAAWPTAEKASTANKQLAEALDLPADTKFFEEDIVAQVAMRSRAAFRATVQSDMYDKLSKVMVDGKPLVMTVKPGDTIPKGWVSMPGLDPALPRVVGPPEIVKELTKVRDIIINDEALAGLSKFFDSWRKTWAGGATGMLPWGIAFHARNATGNAFNAFLAGMTNPARFGEAFGVQRTASKIAREMRKSGVDWETAAKTIGTKQADVDVLRFMRQDGTINSGFFQDLDPDFIDQIKTTRTAKEKLKRQPTDNVGARWGRKMGDTVENNARIALWLDTYAKTGSRREAGERVKKYLLDYNDLTAVDRNLKKIMPFWTFTKKNLALQVETLARNPGRPLAAARAEQSLYGGDGTEPLPGWAAEAGYRPTDALGKGKAGVLGVAMDIETPFDAAARTVNPIVQAATLIPGLRQATPPQYRAELSDVTGAVYNMAGGGPVEFVNFLVEGTTGKDMFTGGNVKDGSTLERFTNIIMPLWGKTETLKGQLSGESKPGMTGRMELLKAFTGINILPLTEKERSQVAYAAKEDLAAAIQALKDEGYDVPTYSEIESAGLVPNLSTLQEEKDRAVREQEKLTGPVLSGKTQTAQNLNAIRLALGVNEPVTPSGSASGGGRGGGGGSRFRRAY